MKASPTSLDLSPNEPLTPLPPRTANPRRSHIPWLLTVGLLCLLPAASRAQCPSGHPGDAAIQQLFAGRQWAGVVSAAQLLRSRSPDVNFDEGMALAQLQRWPQAYAALLAGEHQCTRQKRFPIELAGVAFETKSYPLAARWLRRALKLDPKDRYANDFAGTVYLLMGNLPAALHYWNRIHKPYITAIHLDSHLRVQRLLLERAFVFSPAGTLASSNLLATDARLQALNLFPAYSLKLDALPNGTFDADFHAIERDGFGASRVQAIASTFGGAFYETIYPSYFNLRGSATNIESLLRWDSQKRRVWVSVSAPVRELPQWRWQLAADVRDENWVVRRSFTGFAPSLGSLNLEWQTITGNLSSVANGRWKWSTGVELSHRGYRSVVLGPALTPALLSAGFGLKYLASADWKMVDVPEHRFRLDTGIKSETGRIWSNPSHFFERLQGSALAHWFPQAEGDRYEVQQQARAGGTLGTSPFDQLFMLGVERDNDLWLRGQIGTRDGRKGSAPLGYDYFLSNTDLYRRLYTNGLFGIKIGPIFDIGKMSAPNAGLSTERWLFDTGVEAKLTVLGAAVVLTYGRDLRSGSNAFFGSLAQ